MARLREQMERLLRLSNYSERTRSEYLRCAQHFADSFGKSPMAVGVEEIHAYLLHLIEDCAMKPPSVKMHVAGIKYLYGSVLARPEVAARIPWPRVRSTLPDIPSRAQVEALLAAVANRVHRAAIATMYAAGLRVSEVCSLGIGDIDSERDIIHVRCAKGGRARYVPLSMRLLLLLREYHRRVRPGPTFLFPGQQPLTHVSTTTVRNAVRRACAQSRSNKRITPHTLRHAFATHLLEGGTDLRIIQVVLGHRSPSTTARYAQVSTKLISQVHSPFDRMT
jgi:site-specific recombinase XerD